MSDEQQVSQRKTTPVDTTSTQALRLSTVAALRPLKDVLRKISQCRRQELVVD